MRSHERNHFNSNFRFSVEYTERKKNAHAHTHTRPRHIDDHYLLKYLLF